MKQPKTLSERLAAPTPRFFKKIRNAGLVLAAASAALLASPVALPAVVVQLAGYLAVAGSVATAVSQTVTGGHKRKKEETVREDTHHGKVETVREDTHHGKVEMVREDTHRGKVETVREDTHHGSGVDVVSKDTNGNDDTMRAGTHRGKVKNRKTKSSG